MDDLNLIQKSFLVPLRESKMIQEKDIAGIFSNVELILGFNKYDPTNVNFIFVAVM